MWIIKIGGGKDINIAGIAAGLARSREPFVILHGANALRDELARRLGIEIRRLTSISGVGSVYSDDGLLDLMMMAYSGLQNKRIVEQCQIHGINAVGLSGLDGRMLTGTRNAAVKTRQQEKTILIRDLSGKAKAVNSDLLRTLLASGYRPVLTVPILDEANRAVNSENDDILSLLQRELQAEKVILFISESGFLRDSGDPGSLVPSLSRSELESWTVKSEGRMRRKLHGIRRLLETGTPEVIIADGRSEFPVEDALAGKGTVIYT